MEVAHVELPTRQDRIARAQTKAVSTPAKPSSLRPRNMFQKPACSMGVGIVGVVRDRRPQPPRLPAPIAVSRKKPSPFANMGLRIVRLKGQGAIDQFLRARDVALAGSSLGRELPRAIDQALARPIIARHIMRVKSERALEQAHRVVRASTCRLSPQRSQRASRDRPRRDCSAARASRAGSRP